VQARLAARWPRVAQGLAAAIEWRATTRRESLDRKLTQRQQAEQDRVTSNIDQFAATLRGALAVPEDDAEDALFSRAEVAQWQKSKEELAQFRRDREAWDRRLRTLEVERDRELEVIANRYRDPKRHSFPVAVIFVVPRAEATR
jgi:hypothetical protein